jgi:hypothetical protein
MGAEVNKWPTWLIELREEHHKFEPPDRDWRLMKDTLPPPTNEPLVVMKLEDFDALVSGAKHLLSKVQDASTDRTD